MSRKLHLKMQKVGIEHLKQYSELLRYVFQVTNHYLHQNGWNEEEMLEAIAPILQQADVWGWFDNEKLISQVAVYPLQVRIFNKTFEMGGLTNVGTFPEYSNQGLMNKLLYRALEHMREKKQSISFLYPYSIPYYRRKGWEIISDKITFEVKDYQLPKLRQIHGDIERVDIHSDKVKQAYERFAMQTHGAMLRHDLAWNEYWLWESEDMIAAIYYNEAQQPDGYILYWIANEVFHIKEIIYINEEARLGLWNFISAHFSMITKVEGNIFTDEPLAFLLEDADIKETIAPYYMARIVDVEQFITQYPFKPDNEEREWKFTLDDPLLSWNQGTFTIRIAKDGHAYIARSTGETESRLSIQTLTTMLMGYKSPKYLRKIGRLVCSDETMDMLEDAIEQETPYFSDYF